MFVFKTQPFFSYGTNRLAYTNILRMKTLRLSKVAQNICVWLTVRLPTSTKRRQHRKPVQTRPPRAEQDRRIPPNQCIFLRFCVKKFIFFCVNVLHFVQKALCLATQIKRGCSKCGILRHGTLTRQLLLFWVQLLPMF